jgi:hypothetical protein
MSDIKVPVSAPGATDAAKQINGVADATSKLTVKQHMLKAAGVELKKMMEDTDKQVRESVRNYGNLEKSVNRYSTSARRAAMSENESMMTNRAQKKLLRMIPGGNMIDDVGDMLEGTSKKGLGIALGALVATIGVATVVFSANAKRVEEKNKLDEEALRITQKLNDSARDALRAQQDKAAKSFGSIRASGQVISANLGPEYVKKMAELGGEEAVNKFADLLKDKNARQRLNTLETDLVRELKYVMDLTGQSAGVVLAEMTKQKGRRYNRDKLLEEMTGTNEQGLKTAYEYSGKGSEFDKMAKDYDKKERARIGIEGGRMLDPELVGASMTRLLEETIDPMKKVIDEHNKKILEEIAVREQLLVAERTFVDWWIEVNPRLEAALARAGVRSTAGGAEREIKQKQGLLR